jgi:hypothetical protein
MSDPLRMTDDVSSQQAVYVLLSQTYTSSWLFHTKNTKLHLNSHLNNLKQLPIVSIP